MGWWAGMARLDGWLATGFADELRAGGLVGWWDGWLVARWLDGLVVAWWDG